jgi:ABC-type molybdate transport system ATPase subunit/precorrin-6B methylase 2
MSFDIDISARLGSFDLAARFTAGPGLTALFGASGIGKTSILDMVAGIARPDNGRIVVAGRVLFDSAAGIDVPPEARHAGYVFQDGRLFVHRRVRANLLYGWKRAAPADRWIGFDEVVDLLGIGHLLDRWPATLSGGEAQRVAIGRALLSGARFLLMDEPLASLDAPRKREIIEVIVRLRDELMLPILYVSHDAAEVTALATQRIDLDAIAPRAEVTVDPRWAAVDGYFNAQLLRRDAVLDAALAANAAAGLPAHDVAPNQGKLLALLVQMSGARRILEIGTLGGVSTIWLARAAGTSGQVVTLEADARHAEVARANIVHAGLAARVDLRVGAALDTLPQLADTAPFDLVFIDADKQHNPDYLRWALELSHPGTIIIADNVVRDGAVADAASTDARVHGVRDMLAMLAAEPRLDATALQTVGVKGWDGFAIAIVKAPPTA